jgi:hypothetical protein
VALAIALYSDSMLDVETMAYFQAVHNTRFDPKKTANPLVDLLSSILPAQSASEKALTKLDNDLCMCNPIRVHCFKYLITLLTIVQCTVVGACKN